MLATLLDESWATAHFHLAYHGIEKREKHQGRNQPRLAPMQRMHSAQYRDIEDNFVGLAHSFPVQAHEARQNSPDRGASHNDSRAAHQIGKQQNYHGEADPTDWRT